MAKWLFALILLGCSSVADHPPGTGGLPTDGVEQIEGTAGSGEVLNPARAGDGGTSRGGARSTGGATATGGTPQSTGGSLSLGGIASGGTLASLCPNPCVIELPDLVVPYCYLRCRIAALSSTPFAAYPCEELYLQSAEVVALAKSAPSC
jgi:hypothetical protein